MAGQTGALGVPVPLLAMEGPKHEIEAAPILHRPMMEGIALGFAQGLGSVVQWLALVSILKTVAKIKPRGSNFPL